MQLLLLQRIGLHGQRLVQVLHGLVVIALVLEHLGQGHGRLGRRLHLVVLLGDLEIEVAVALGARHERHGLRQHGLVIGRCGELRREQTLQVLAAGGAAQTERRIELLLALGCGGIALEQGRQTLVLGDHLVGRHLVVLVVVAEVLVVDHHQLGIRLAVGRGDRLAERVADAFAVRRTVEQHLLGLVAEDVGGTLPAALTEVFGLHVVHHEQRIDVGILLVAALRTVDLVAVDQLAVLEDIDRRLRTVVHQLAQMGQRLVVALVLHGFCQEVAGLDVGGTLLDGLAVTGELRTAEILLRHGRRARKRESCRK